MIAWVAETLGYPIFVVEQWATDEIEKWAAVLAIRNGNSSKGKDGGKSKSTLDPEKITLDDSAFLVQAYLQQFGAEMI